MAKSFSPARGGGDNQAAIRYCLGQIAAGFAVIEDDIGAGSPGIGNFTNRTLWIDQGQLTDRHVVHRPRRGADVARVRGAYHYNPDILQSHLSAPLSISPCAVFMI